MNIAYFGSPELSAQLLESLIKNEDIHIKLIVTQPDKPAGKHLALTPTVVKKHALNSSIPIFDKNIDQTHKYQLLKLFQKYDIELCIVFAYGTIIPIGLLNGVKHGFWNIHPSLLPKYRGASPTIYPIALGDKKTGVTLMKMCEKMDEGDIIDQKTIQIDQNMTRVDIEDRSVSLAEDMIVHAVERIITNKSLSSKPQDHAQATYTRRIEKKDGYIPFEFLIQALKTNQSPMNKLLPQLISSYYQENNLLNNQNLPVGQIVWNLYRALAGWPGIWTMVSTPQGKKRLIIKDMIFDGNKATLKIVQLEGKKEVKFKEFNQTYNIIK